MKKGVWILVAVGIVLILIVVFLVLTNNKGNDAGVDKSNDNSQTSGPIKCDNMPCLGRYFPTCTPAELTMPSGNQSFIITIHGFENEKCHYTMVMNGITAADCYFKTEDLNDKVLNQMFGNKEGQDAVIAEACGTA